MLREVLDLAPAPLFDTLAVVALVRAPMRPRPEVAVFLAGYVCVFAHFQAAFLRLHKSVLAWPATLVVDDLNLTLAGAQARAETSVYVAPIIPISDPAILWQTRGTVITIPLLAADPPSLLPHAFLVSSDFD